MSYKTDYQNVSGLGRAGEGVHHFWIQRLTAIALVPLAILFVIPFGQALGGGHAALVATYGQFGHAVTAMLFIAVACWHFTLGLQAVIEDYTDGFTRLVLLILSKLFGAVMGVSGVVAIATILFRA